MGWSGQQGSFNSAPPYMQSFQQQLINWLGGGQHGAQGGMQYGGPWGGGTQYQQQPYGNSGGYPPPNFWSSGPYGQGQGGPQQGQGQQGPYSYGNQGYGQGQQGNPNQGYNPYGPPPQNAMYGRQPMQGGGNNYGSPGSGQYAPWDNVNHGTFGMVHQPSAPPWGDPYAGSPSPFDYRGMNQRNQGAWGYGGAGSGWGGGFNNTGIPRSDPPTKIPTGLLQSLMAGG